VKHEERSRKKRWKGKEVIEIQEGKLKDEDEIDGEEGWSRKTSERGEEGGEGRRDIAQLVRGKRRMKSLGRVVGRRMRRKREGWKEEWGIRDGSGINLWLRERRRRRGSRKEEKD
jgi:hypothetical protein